MSGKPIMREAVKPQGNTAAAEFSSNTQNTHAKPGICGLNDEMNLYQNLPVIIAVRAVLLLAGINLSDRVGLLPEHLGPVAFVPFFNALVAFLTILYLVLWRLWRACRPQLYFQIAADLVMATIFVASTHGSDGPFISFYLLIIIYCSLTLGKSGGILSAALCVICYSGIVIATRMGLISSNYKSADVFMDAFQIGFHTLSFGAIAYLGTSLNRRLHAMERVIDEKNEFLAQLYRLNDHIVSSIRSGLITTDLKGRISVFNAAAGTMTGRKPKEVIGAPIYGIIGEIFWGLIVEADLFKGIQSMRHEAWVRHSDGSMRFFGFTVSPLFDADNRQLGYIFSFQDLSEIVRLEKEVRFRERLSAVGRMAVTVAHEIRNPLTAIRGSVELLRSRANLTEKDERLLNILISESDRLDLFVEDFLDFARPKPKPKTVLDVIPILRDSVTLMKNNPEIKGKYSVNLNIEIPDMYILGNADQIRQVFWNVTQNAMRAMPEGGNIAIRAVIAGNGAGEVTFTDNGVGMTPEEIEQIFQPFNSGFSKGLGLGISIIFQIMDDHHGRIMFESEKGKGTKVILAFPLEFAIPEVDVLGNAAKE